MALVDSEAAFEKRCKELDPNLYDTMSNAGIVTFASLAYAVGAPQTAPTDEAMQRFADRIFLVAATLAQVSKVKRLHFEAVTLVVADLKRQVTAGDVTEPGKTLPFIEKQRRLRAQQTRITGISHKHEQQASHALIDAAFNILETGAVVYLPPSKCGSRDAEIQSEAKNKQKQLLTLEQGTIKATASDALVSVDIGTEMKLMYALQRRGLAFDLVNLVSWPVHMEWVNKLFRALMSEAIPGFNSITLQQLLRADQELFLTIAAEFDGSLKGANVGDPPPLDAVIQRLMNDPRINIHLTPTARGEKRSIQQEGDKVSNPPPKKQKQPKPGAQRSPSQLPSELTGLHLKTKDGKPICWKRNLKQGCSNEVKKGRCRFGFHVCMRCLKTGHGAANCQESS